MLLIQISITSEAHTRVTSGANSVTHVRRKGDPTHVCNRIVVASNVIFLPTTRVTDSSNKLRVPCCSPAMNLHHRLVSRRLPTLAVVNGLA